MHTPAIVFRPRNHRGFTLVELMVTIAIIGVALAVTLPQVGQAMRDRRVQQAAVTFMDAFRTARTRSMMRGRAHLVVVDVSGAALAQRVVESIDSSSCRLANWASATATRTLASIDFAAPGYARDQLTMAVQTPPSARHLEMCYTPTGRLFYRLDPGSPFTDDNGATVDMPLNGGFMFTVVQAGGRTVTRRVFVPLGGAPRLAQ